MISVQPDMASNSQSPGETWRNQQMGILSDEPKLVQWALLGPRLSWAYVGILRLYIQISYQLATKFTISETFFPSRTT